jgi:hypothetical protein
MFYSFIDLDNNSYENSSTDNKFSDNLLPLPCLLFKNNIFVDTDNLNSAFNENDKGINLEGSHSEPEQSFINKLDLCKIIEEKSTAVTNNQIPMNQNKKDNLKKYTFNDIKQILKDKDFEKYIQIIDNTKDEPKLKESKKNIRVINKKKKKSFNLKNQVNKIYINHGYGRKKKEDTSSRIHTKYTPDNIIKKIKGRFIDYLITFFNNMITNKAKANEQTLKKINYKKYVNIMNKDSNLNFLEKPVKDILSEEISPKYSSCSPNWNKKIIEKILKKYKDDKNIIFALEMKFKKWIDIFLMKNSIKTYLNEKECKEFEDYLPKINSLFEEILKERDGKKYLSDFIFYCYNYEAWFNNKIGRSIKKKE